MSWKNYFFFHRQDRMAIIMLILLIVLSVGFYVNYNIYQKSKSETISDADLKREFLAKTDSINRIRYNISSPRKLELGEQINLNMADTTDLKRIPGIGSVYANRIMEYINKQGRIDSIAQLKEIKGMKGKTLIKIIPYISVD